MILDSIKIRTKRVLTSNKLQRIFSEGTETYTNDELLYMNGNLRNLRISKSKQYITIYGSLAEYLNNNNVSLLDFETFKLAISKLSKDLDIDLSESDIMQIDLALNIESNVNIKLLFNYFGERKATNRNIDKTTLYYTNRNIKITIYDKTIQSLSKFGLTLEENIIRIEIRFKNNSLKSFCKKQNIGEVLKVKHLFQPDIFESMINEWRLQYYSINKNSVIGINEKCISSPKAFKNALYKQGIISMGGANKVIGFVENTKKNIPIKHKEYISRIKREINDCDKYSNTLTYNIDFLDFEAKIENELKYNIFLCQNHQI